jgi:hypothetical protein
MIAEAPAERPADWHPSATSHDENEQLKSLFWFDRERSAGKLWDYLGKYVAILGEKIIDADPDGAALCARLEANYPPEANIIIQDMHPAPNWK